MLSRLRSHATGELGDTDAALDNLQVALDAAMDAAMRGEDAAEAIRQLIDRINELAGTTALNDSFNAFVSGLGGTIEEQISAVVDQMTRVVDPKMLAKLRSFLTELRRGVSAYEDPSKAGYAPSSNGVGFTTGQPGGAETARAIASARDFTQARKRGTGPSGPGHRHDADGVPTGFGRWGKPCPPPPARGWKMG